jgi:hypothetical protein
MIAELIKRDSSLQSCIAAAEKPAKGEGEGQLIMSESLDLYHRDQRVRGEKKEPSEARRRFIFIVI